VARIGRIRMALRIGGGLGGSGGCSVPHFGQTGGVRARS